MHTAKIGFMTRMWATLTVAAIATCGVASCASGGAGDDGPDKSSATSEPVAETNDASASFSYDITDKRAVAGHASVVFLGKVVKKIGSAPRVLGTAKLVKFPQTQFEVQVIASLKGGRIGSIAVNQMGGYTERGDLQLLEGNKLLEVGSVYLLAAKYSKANKWYTVIPIGGTVLDPTSSAEAQRSAGSSPLINEWRDAVANAKPGRRAPATPPPAGQDTLPTAAATPPAQTSSPSPKAIPSSGETQTDTPPESSSTPPTG